MPELTEIAQTAKEAAAAVGSRMTKETRGAFSVKIKGVRDFVTEIDVWAEEQIKKAVLTAFHSHVIIGEESMTELVEQTGKKLEHLAREDHVWIVDPIDGTSNFVNGLPHSAVSIAYLERGVRCYGLVYDPYRGEFFEAINGGGAFLNSVPIKAADKSEMSQCILATGCPPGGADALRIFHAAFAGFMTRSHKMRVLGAAALELCWVACGRLDGFFEYGLKPWDVAAGSLIAEEAGAVVGSFAEEDEVPFSIFSPSTLAFVAPLYKEARSIAHAAFKGTGGAD